MGILGRWNSEFCGTWPATKNCSKIKVDEQASTLPGLAAENAKSQVLYEVHFRFPIGLQGCSSDSEIVLKPTNYREGWSS